MRAGRSEHRHLTVMLILFAAADIIQDLIVLRMHNPAFKQYYEATWSWTEPIWKIMLGLSIILVVKLVFPRTRMFR